MTNQGNQSDPDSWAKIFPDSALIESYFASYAEPHRRYPTIIYYPRFVIHLATECKDRVYLLNLLNETFITSEAQWRRRVPSTYETGGDGTASGKIEPYEIEQFNKEFFERFVKFLRTDTNNPEEDSVSLDEVLSFEAIPPGIDGKAVKEESKLHIIVRIEVHTTYFSVTIFVPLKSDPRSYLAESNGQDFCGTKRTTSSFNFLDQDIYTRIPDELVSSTSLGETARAMNCLVASLASFEKATFANFRGVIIPADLAGASSISRPEDMTESDAPCFLTPFESEFPEKAPLGNTTLYLRRVWKSLCASVFATRFTDVIACYLARGQMIYLSNLGAQRFSAATPETGTPPRDPLRFLLIYGRKFNAANSADSDSARLKQIEETQRWAFSRLLNRLLNMGTTRLLAMRKLSDLLTVERKLPEIEKALWKTRSERDLAKISNQLERLADKGAIISDTKSVDLAYSTMTRLLGDLGIVQVPGFQAYDMFIRRRLDGTYNQIVGLGEKLERIWQIYRARQQEQEAKTSLATQIFANVIAIFGVVATVDQIVTIPYLIDAVNFVFKLGYVEIVLLASALNVHLPEPVLAVFDLNHKLMYRWAIDFAVGWSTFTCLKGVIRGRDEQAAREEAPNWGRD